MEELEHIPPEKDSKLFCQERLDAIDKVLQDTIRDTGFKKLMNELWHEELVKPHVSELSLEQVIERYGSVLTEKELNKLKEIISNGKK